MGNDVACTINEYNADDDGDSSNSSSTTTITNNNNIIIIRAVNTALAYPRQNNFTSSFVSSEKSLYFV